MHFNIRAALITSFNELFIKAVTVVLRGILSYTSRVKNHLDLVLYKLNPSLMQVAAKQEQQDWPSNEIEGSSLGYIYVPVLPFVLVSCLKVKLTESFYTKKKCSLSHMDLPFFHAFPKDDFSPYLFPMRFPWFTILSSKYPQKHFINVGKFSKF
jgi:hypothetical protein